MCAADRVTPLVEVVFVHPAWVGDGEGDWVAAKPACCDTVVVFVDAGL